MNCDARASLETQRIEDDQIRQEVDSALIQKPAGLGLAAVSAKYASRLEIRLGLRPGKNHGHSITHTGWEVGCQVWDYLEPTIPGYTGRAGVRKGTSRTYHGEWEDRRIQSLGLLRRFRWHICC